MKIIYYITNVLIILSSLLGTANVFFNSKSFIERMAGLGHAPYLGDILAIFQIVAFVVLVLNLFRVKLGGLEFLKEWAYAGSFILFSGAFLSHVFNGDGEFLPALVFLIILLTAYFSNKKVNKS